MHRWNSSSRRPVFAAALALGLGLTAFGCTRPADTSAPKLADRAAVVDPLPSWNDTAPKKAIVAFVERVTKEDSPDFVPVSERIATFDNDGTLWAEQPMYVQVLFLIDRVKALSPQHPEWKTKEPFASLLKGDMDGVAATGEKGAIEMMVATHTGMTTEEFTGTVSDWIATARHNLKAVRGHHPPRQKADGRNRTVVKR
ncbi:MAG TPA: hypothetical protein VM818_01260 [Vicinamibacterales bacterium]|nr:hypothetical protein [Vicinamibacterales bacterium]